ncbi:hypothetical protein B481_0581 [Planococcus halocryophilus Or1]|nr:hypothetical protein B481_0581 [Planococcus halocryophilus Or1]
MPIECPVGASFFGAQTRQKTPLVKKEPCVHSNACSMPLWIAGPDE